MPPPPGQISQLAAAPSTALLMTNLRIIFRFLPSRNKKSIKNQDAKERKSKPFNDILISKTVT